MDDLYPIGLTPSLALSRRTKQRAKAAFASYAGGIMSVPVKGNGRIDLPNRDTHTSPRSFVSHSRTKSRASRMADLATRKIKIVGGGQTPAHTSRVRANLMSFSQLKGATPDLSAATFQIADESHTIGNALRWMIMKKCATTLLHSIVSLLLTLDSPKVEFCGYR